MNVAERKCGSCKHFESTERACRRYPPAPIGLMVRPNGNPEFRVGWPIVSTADTCGEWDTQKLAPAPEVDEFSMQKGRLEERGDVVEWLTEAQFHVVAQGEVAVILKLREQFRRGMHTRRNS